MFGEKAYISTQGPKKDKNDEDEEIDTRPDFWRMVWDYKANVVVMLTKIVEDDEYVLEKCTQYWPTKIGDSTDYKDARLLLTWLEQEDMPGIEIRTFSLKRDDEERTIKQIHYTGWPDHGVPSRPEEFVALCDRVDELNHNSNAPLVVHCSAGVGRSGTFIGIHSYVRFLRETYEKTGDLEDLNVPDLLVRLRKDRPKMVQTKEQYEFIYKAILLEFEVAFDRFLKKEGVI